MAQNAQRTPNTARQRFIAELPARVQSLQATLESLIEDPRSEPARQILARRLVAMTDVCAQLGLDELAQAFTSAESALAGLGTSRAERALAEVRDILSLVPSLVPAQAETRTATNPRPTRTAIALGVLALGEDLRSWARELPDVHFEFTVDPDDACDLAKTANAALCIIDARRPDAERALLRLRPALACVLVHVAEGQAPSWATAVPMVNKGTSALPVLKRALSQGASHSWPDTQDSEAPLAEKSAPAPSITLPRPPGYVSPRAVPPSANHQVERQVEQPSPALVAEERALIRTKRRQHSPEVTNLPHRKVLIADADPATAWFLAGVLKAAHAEIIEARDGLEAWSLAQRFCPDLVVADVALGGMDGFGLSRNIKRDVALADVPVLLLAWKTEELQRARELGAGADAYLLKEAHAPIILRRCAEVLDTRAAVERRIRDEHVFTGRLDGMTPHTVLRLACDLVANARVTFADAGYEFVATIADGRLFNAERRLVTGERQDGTSALSGLLGMRAGSFRIEPGEDNPQAAFSGSLSHALGPIVQRVRRALRIIQGDLLHKVHHLELDKTNVAPYLDASPSVVSRLVAKLQAGVAPSALLRSISPGLLESVLTDIAIRGAVRAAIDTSGTDLLESEGLLDQPFDVELRTPIGGFEASERVEQAPAPGPVALDDAFDQLESLPPPAVSGAAAPTLREPREEASALVFDELYEVNSRSFTSSEQLQRAPKTPATPGPSARAVPTRAEPRAEPAPTLVEAPTSNSEAFQSAPPRVTADPPAERRVAAPEAVPVAAPGSRQSAAPARTSRREAAASRDAEMDTEFDLSVAVFSLTSATPSTPARAASHDDRAADPNPPDRTVEHASTLDAAPRSTQPATSSATTRDPQPNTTRHVSQGTAEANARPLAASVAARVAGATNADERPKERPRAPGEGEPPGLLLADSLTESERVPPIDLDADHDPLFDSLLSSPRSKNKTSEASTSPPARSRATLRERSKGDSQTAPRSSNRKRPSERALGVPPTAASNSPSVAPVERLVASAARAANAGSRMQSWLRSRFTPAKRAKEPTADAPRFAVKLRAVGGQVRRSLVPAAAVLGAATLTFAGMGLLVDQLRAPEPPTAGAESELGPATPAAHPATLEPPAAPRSAAASPSDDVSSVAPPTHSAAASPQLEMTTSDLPLPDGIQVAPGKGLLEVNSGGKHKIYVESVFVGRGPVRRVPLQAGAHRVTMRRDGEEVNVDVTVVANRRARLEPKTLAGVADGP